MNILVVGNILKDVYLNLDPRSENIETDKNGSAWLDLEFNGSKHHFFSRHSSFGGAAISLEVLKKLGLDAEVANSSLAFADDGLISSIPASVYRYILVSNEQVSYFTPTKPEKTVFDAPEIPYDYLFIDRSAELDQKTIEKIQAYLDTFSTTKLILYLKDEENRFLNSLIPRADLVFSENNRGKAAISYAPELKDFDPKKLVFISENRLSSLGMSEYIEIPRADVRTHLSAYSIAAATILGGFILGKSVEESLEIARINVENSKLDSCLTLKELESLVVEPSPTENLELIAKSLVIPKKGILAADESGGSIAKKFAQLNIPDTYENRRDYRNIFFTTPDLEKYISGVILFDETARQFSDDGRNFVDFLTSRRIIPGIKVDEGLEPLNPDEKDGEKYTKGLENLPKKLPEYYEMGLRFAKWRAAFEIHLDENGNILTPTDAAIEKNCQILADYAKNCQTFGLVPIVEPEVVYDGLYSIDDSAKVTGKILDELFKQLEIKEVSLRACLLKVNMILAGKQSEVQSLKEEVGFMTAKVLKEHVPNELAGVVFLSGGQTPEQATENLAEVTKNGPFPWPVTFSFARALQDPALFTWAGDNKNANPARAAFLARLIANTSALL